MAETMNVEVCYALRDKQEVVRLQLPEGATLQQGSGGLRIACQIPGNRR